MILIMIKAFRWSPLSSTYLRTSWTQVSNEVYHTFDAAHKFTSSWFVIFHAFFDFFFRILAECHLTTVACLANVKETICHSAFKECAEVDGTFVPALLWSVHKYTFCSKKLDLFAIQLLVVLFPPVGSFCSRSECERRKAIWDACVAEIQQDPGQKRDFDAQMLAVMETIGQCSQTNRRIHDVLFDRLPSSLHTYP